MGIREPGHQTGFGLQVSTVFATEKGESECKPPALPVKAMGWVRLDTLRQEDD